MIKVTGKSAVRKTTAQYIAPETGEKHEIDVLYYSHTTAALKQRMADAAKEDEEYAKQSAAAEKRGKPLPPRLFFPTVRMLAFVLNGLPDLADANGKAFKITADNLDTLTQENIDAIDKAIKEDIDGKKSPPAE
jgi:hypothetical protein